MSTTDQTYLGTVLVTGGAGIVGSFVVEKLVKESACEKVVATYHSQKTYQHRCDGVDYHVCNITDPSEVEKLLNETNPNVIIHTVSPGPFASPEAQYRVNYEATKELVRLATAQPTVKAFVYTSTLDAIAYRQNPPDVETEETCKLHNLDTKVGTAAYGRTKGAADGLVLAANTGHEHQGSDSYVGKLLTTTLRVGGVYGERDATTIHTIMKLTNKFETRFQIGPDTALHEFVFTDNVANAHLLAAKALLDGRHTTADMKADGEAFFITDDSPMPMFEFSRKVWKAAGDKNLNSQNPAGIIQIPFWITIKAVSAVECFRRLIGWKGPELMLSTHRLEYLQAGYRLSIEKARKRLGYISVCNTDEGIERSVAWFQNKENEEWIYWHTK